MRIKERHVENTIIVVTLLLAMAVILLVAKPIIDKWERQNNYPYGLMCHSIFTGNVNTCPAQERKA